MLLIDYDKKALFFKILIKDETLPIEIFIYITKLRYKKFLEIKYKLNRILHFKFLKILFNIEINDGNGFTTLPDV